MFNPYARRPAHRQAVSREFTDAGDTITLTFIKPGQLQKCAAVDMATALIKQYLGDKGPGWPPMGGVQVPVSEMAVHNAALYCCMQPDDAPERYTAEAFVAFQAVLSDDVWQQISAFASEVIAGADPTPCGADTPPGSASA